jgi:hypothetical protein
MMLQECHCVELQYCRGCLTGGLSSFGAAFVQHGCYRFQLPSLIKALSGRCVVPFL